MNIHEYRTKLHTLEEANLGNLRALKEWVSNDALPWLWVEVAGAVLSRKPKHPQAITIPSPPQLKPLAAAEAVRQGVFTSVIDLDNKCKEPSYYNAQLTMLDAEAERYCVAIDRLLADPSGPYVNSTVHTLHRALLELMGYADVMLEDAASQVAEVGGYYGSWRRKHDLPLEVIMAAEQVTYGTYSGLAFFDRAPYVPVAILRTAIELRLRHAFCVYSMTDTAKPGEIIPIDLSKLMDAILNVEPEIMFAVNIHDVWKIYRWCNFYLHKGVRDYPWVPGFLLRYVRPLFVGPNNIDGGIRMNRQTWHAVRNSLRESVKRPHVFKRFVNALRALFGKNRNLELPDYDESDAQCVFLD